jgi:hypothetical protein
MEEIDLDDKIVWVFERGPHHDRLVYYTKVGGEYFISASAEVRDESITWEARISEAEAADLKENAVAYEAMLQSDRRWTIKKSWEKSAYIKNGRLGPEDGFINQGYGRPW